MSPLVTGAEAVAFVLRLHGVECVFAYPGTSELALCDAIERTPGLRLVNGRGDKECVFQAAGASLVEPTRGVALVHGARGLTNAAGAVAAVRRNEIGTLVVVGLPSTGSTRFLPPHGEENLIATIGAFSGWSWEAAAVPADPADRRKAATEFVHHLYHALRNPADRPPRPALFAIPQDVAEQRWIPRSALAGSPPVEPRASGDRKSLGLALDILSRAVRPLVVIDDYALRRPRSRESLALLTGLLGAPLFQLRYRRGPMLFERARHEELPGFLGWLDPADPAHSAMLERCDALITVEDRNLYRRVAGKLPDRPTIAITSDREKVLKNEYLGPGDVILSGAPEDIVEALAGDLSGPAERWYDDPVETAPAPVADTTGEMRERLHKGIVQALAEVLRSWPRPAVVDDSQMFGGLVSQHYDLLPRGVRVFGDHGGFVGAGLATATGLALGDSRFRVLCLLGDQGFVNGMQGLVAAVQERARVVFVICDNGESVSLVKQAKADRPAGADRRSYLSNTPHLSYREVAQSFGIPAWTVRFPWPATGSRLGRALEGLHRALAGARAADGPAVVVLKLPSHPDAWRGIWRTRGLEGEKA